MHFRSVVMCAALAKPGWGMRRHGALWSAEWWCWSHVHWDAARSHPHTWSGSSSTRGSDLLSEYGVHVLLGAGGCHVMWDVGSTSWAWWDLHTVCTRLLAASAVPACVVVMCAAHAQPGWACGGTGHCGVHGGGVGATCIGMQPEVIHTWCGSSSTRGSHLLPGYAVCMYCWGLGAAM